jgi:hypothetical protein
VKTGFGIRAVEGSGVEMPGAAKGFVNTTKKTGPSTTREPVMATTICSASRVSIDMVILLRKVNDLMRYKSCRLIRMSAFRLIMGDRQIYPGN